MLYEGYFFFNMLTVISCFAGPYLCKIHHSNEYRVTLNLWSLRLRSVQLSSITNKREWDNRHMTIYPKKKKKKKYLRISINKKSIFFRLMLNSATTNTFHFKIWTKFLFRLFKDVFVPFTTCIPTHYQPVLICGFVQYLKTNEIVLTAKIFWDTLAHHNECASSWISGLFTAFQLFSMRRVSTAQVKDILITATVISFQFEVQTLMKSHMSRQLRKLNSKWFQSTWSIQSNYTLFNKSKANSHCPMYISNKP